MSKAGVSEFQNMLMVPSLHHQLLKVLRKKISYEEEVSVRLKGLTLVHLLLSAKINHETNLEL